MYSLNFSSLFSNVFKKYGILSVKKDRKCVNIPRKFMLGYIKGLFDADGCIMWGNRKDRNRLWAGFNITHASYEVLSTVQRYLLEEHNLAFSLTKRRDEECYDLKTSRRDDIVELFCLLFEDTSCKFYLPRKKKHFLDFIEIYLKG